jgi:cytochrome c
MLYAILVSTATSETLTPEAQKGLALVRANCARCHAIGKTGDSPFKPAPPFRTLHHRYPVESLEESLGELG